MELSSELRPRSDDPQKGENLKSLALFLHAKMLCVRYLRENEKMLSGNLCCLYYDMKIVVLTIVLGFYLYTLRFTFFYFNLNLFAKSSLVAKAYF